jgi:hypothetical protein
MDFDRPLAELAARGSWTARNRDPTREGAGLAGARGAEKQMGMADYMGVSKADRKVWSDLCKHRLGQEVNMALTISLQNPTGLSLPDPCDDC